MYPFGLGSKDFGDTVRESDARAARASGHASSALFKLVKSSLLDQLHATQPAERRLAVRFYKKAEVCQVSWGVYKPRKVKGGSRKVSEQEFLDNQKRNTVRASANMRRDLLSIGADRMLTLTYKENMVDRAQSLRDLRKFVRMMRRAFKHWASVAVMELQERGAIHFHIGIAGFYDARVLRAAWYSIVGEGGGSVNISYKPDGWGNSRSKLASYMSKYLQKSLDEGRKPGEHRYFRTEGIERPREVYYLPASAPKGQESLWALDIICSLLGTKERFPTVWSSSSCGRNGGYMVGDLSTEQEKPTEVR